MNSNANFDSQLYDETEPGYYDAVYRRGSGVQWFWHHYRFAAVVENLPAGGGQILDVGCGPGTFLGHFTKGFSRGLGVELARAQVEYARKTYGSDRLRFEAHDVTAFDTEDRFDVIVSIEVIEHLAPKDTNAFLNRLRELLKPGGTLILTTPNYRSFWPIIEWMISKKGPVDYLRQHINHFNTRRLTSELAAAGFDIIRQRTFFVVAPFLAAISRPLAEWFYAAERLLLPRLGSEIVVAARKPQPQS